MSPRKRTVGPYLILSLAVTLLMVANAHGVTKSKVYLLAGQSNCIGYQGDPKPFPDSLQQPQPAIRICGICGVGDQGKAFGDGCAGTTYAATKGWTTLRPNWFGAGFNGSYISFGHDMHKARPADSMVIICAGEISSLAENWLPPSSPGATGPMWPLFMQGIRRQIAALGSNYECEIAGMMWMQGELDAQNGTGSTYKANLSNLIKDVRDSLKLPNLPFVIGQISLHDWGADLATVRQAQADVAATVPHTGIVDTKAFDIADDGHYTELGQVQLGDGFSREMLRLLAATSSNPAQPSHGTRPASTLRSGRLFVDGPATVKVCDIRGRTLRSEAVTAGATVDLRVAGSRAAVVTVQDNRGISRQLVIR